MATLQPVRGPEIDLDFTGRDYQREHLPATANEGDICTLAYSGGSGWYNAEYIYSAGEWQPLRDTRPWQMAAWNIGGGIPPLGAER